MLIVPLATGKAIMLTALTQRESVWHGRAKKLKLFRHN